MTTPSARASKSRGNVTCVSRNEHGAGDPRRPRTPGTRGGKAAGTPIPPKEDDMNGTLTPDSQEDLVTLEGTLERTLPPATAEEPSPQFDAFGAAEETPEQAVARIIAEEDLTQAQVAKESGINGSVLSTLIKGTYAGDKDAQRVKLVKWLSVRGQRARARAVLPAAPGYVKCPTSETIWAAIAYAQAADAMAYVVGVPGVGKTFTARQYRDTQPSAWLVTMSPTSAGVVPALEEIAEALGLRPEGGARRIEKAIARKVQGTNGVLLIDEAQHLSPPALDAIRSIHDATGIGVCYLGNEDLAAKIAGGRRAERTAQLSSRIGYRRNIRRPVKADVTALLDAWQVRGRAERDYLADVGTRPGGLRTMTKLLQLASVMAASADQPLARAHLEQAWRQLGGLD